MRFRSVHKLMSYLLVTAAVGTLLTSGAVPMPTLALLLALAVLSWFVEPGTRMGGLLDRAGLVFNVVALAFFGLSLFQVIESFPEPDFTPILNLVLFLLGYKLFHRRNNRDYLQVYVLSFMLILAAAWLAQTALFVVGFAAYVVLATWTMVLFQLRREIEDNYLVKHLPESGTEKVTAARVLNSRRVVGRPFFLATGGVALSVFLGAGLVFAAIPRIGVGFLSGSFRRRVNIVGFSDKVTLGHHGIISGENQTAVLWVKMPRLAALPDEELRDRFISQLYWRGTVYDTYLVQKNPDGVFVGNWERVARDDTRPRLEEGANRGRPVWWLRPAEAPPGKRRPKLDLLDEQEIQLVGMENPVAFALDEPIAFRAPAPAAGSFVSTVFENRYAGEVGLANVRLLDGSRGTKLKEFTGARYFAYSRNPLLRASADQGRPTAELQHEGHLTSYLAPPAKVSPRVVELARKITEGATGPMAKVQAVVAWLRSTHGYTTNLQRNRQIVDPLEDFLFHMSAGHCEYFASAAAVLLRLSGVPTRYVNGFLGGEWNDLGQYLVVRNNRAHSWVEAYVGEPGWVRVDATPVASASSRMGRLRQVFDSVEFFWSRWVLDYDASRQIELARKIGSSMGVGRGGLRDGAWRKVAVRWGILAVALGVALFLIGRRLNWRWRRRPGTAGARARRGGTPVVRLYERTLTRLSRRGWIRGPAETPREFAERLRTAALPGAVTVGRLTEVYGQARFGERDIDDALVAALERELEDVARQGGFDPVEPGPSPGSISTAPSPGGSAAPPGGGTQPPGRDSAPPP